MISIQVLHTPSALCSRPKLHLSRIPAHSLCTRAGYCSTSEKHTTGQSFWLNKTGQILGFGHESFDRLVFMRECTLPGTGESFHANLPFFPLSCNGPLPNTIQKFTCAVSAAQNTMLLIWGAMGGLFLLKFIQRQVHLLLK